MQHGSDGTDVSTDDGTAKQICEKQMCWDRYIVPLPVMPIDNLTGSASRYSCCSGKQHCFCTYDGIQVWGNGCTCYHLAQHWMNLWGMLTDNKQNNWQCLFFVWSINQEGLSCLNVCQWEEKNNVDRRRVQLNFDWMNMEVYNCVLWHSLLASTFWQTPVKHKGSSHENLPQN